MNAFKNEYYPFPRDLSTLLDGFFKSQNEDASFVATGTWAPAVDIKEEKHQFIVSADIPGMNKEDILISLENNILILQGERKTEKTAEKERYSRIERSQGQFYRRFSLPQMVDEQKIAAKYKQGVLEITIPKKEENKQKRIEIALED